MTNDLPTPGDELDEPDDVQQLQAQAVKRLDADVDTVPLADGFGDPIRHGELPLLDNLVRALVAVGFTIHDCAGHAPGGGVCLTPLTTQEGIAITWTKHDAAETELAWDASSEIQTLMNDALADVALLLGFKVEPFGTGGSNRVTGLADSG
jgi:hypothetical protein